MFVDPFPLKSAPRGDADPDLARAWYNFPISNPATCDPATAQPDDLRHLRVQLMHLRGPVRAIADAAVALAIGGISALVLLNLARAALHPFFP